MARLELWEKAEPRPRPPGSLQASCRSFPRARASAESPGAAALGALGAAHGAAPAGIEVEQPGKLRESVLRAVLPDFDGGGVESLPENDRSPWPPRVAVRETADPVERTWLG